MRARDRGARHDARAQALARHFQKAELADFADLDPRAVVLQTARIGNHIMAWLVNDDRYLVGVDPSEDHEGAAKQWFVEWFVIKYFLIKAYK